MGGFKNMIFKDTVVYLRNTNQRLKSSESHPLITSAKQCWQVGKKKSRQKMETLQIFKAQLTV